MKNKSNAFYYFRILKNQVDKESNANIKVLRADGGMSISLMNFQIICTIVAYANNLRASIHPNKTGLLKGEIE